jgi:hypothetical protein
MCDFKKQQHYTWHVFSYAVYIQRSKFNFSLNWQTKLRKLVRNTSHQKCIPACNYTSLTYGALRKGIQWLRGLMFPGVKRPGRGVDRSAVQYQGQE